MLATFLRFRNTVSHLFMFVEKEHDIKNEIENPCAVIYMHNILRSLIGFLR